MLVRINARCAWATRDRARTWDGTPRSRDGMLLSATVERLAQHRRTVEGPEGQLASPFGATPICGRRRGQYAAR